MIVYDRHREHLLDYRDVMDFLGKIKIFKFSFFRTGPGSPRRPLATW